MDFSLYLFIFCYFSSIFFHRRFSPFIFLFRWRRESVEMHISIVRGKLSKKWAKEEENKSQFKLRLKLSDDITEISFSSFFFLSFSLPLFTSAPFVTTAPPHGVAYFTRCRQQQANFRLLRLENAENSRFKLLNRITIKAILKILCSSTKCWIIMGLWKGGCTKKKKKKEFFNFATFLSRYILRRDFFFLLLLFIYFW